MRGVGSEVGVAGAYKMKYLLLFVVLSWTVIATPLPFIANKLEEPATLTILREAAISKGAVCLDGSPPGYYFRPGKDLNKWILHLQGGGWCDHGTEDCYNRSFTKLGSSANWTSSQDFHGALSSNVDITPFYNWNMVFLNYCDGASFAGDREETDVWNGKKLYYRGYRILTAIMEDLNLNRNLKQATDVVLTGCSAGGLAVYMHMNYIQKLIPPTAHYSGLPDAGFFLDIPSYNTTVHNSHYAYQLILLQEVDKALMEECKQDYPGELVWKCIYAPYIYKYIQAPLMVINSRYDTAQLHGFLLPCLPPNCNTEEMLYFNFFAESFKEQVGVVTTNTTPSNAYFLDSCLVHCQTLDDHTWTEFKVQDRSMSQAVYLWYFGSTQVKVDDCDYPCNPTCPGHYPPS